MVKTYAQHFVTKYEYKYTQPKLDSEGNPVLDSCGNQIMEEACDTLVFTANTGLFVLFKAYTKKELGDVVKEFKDGLIKLTASSGNSAMRDYLKAQTDDEKLKVLEEHPDDLLRYVGDTYGLGMLDNGMSLFEVLPICMYAASHNREEQNEILALGYDALPSEVYEDLEFGVELLKLVFDFDTTAKKKHLYGAKAVRR